MPNSVAPVFHGEVKDGKLHLWRAEDFAGWVRVHDGKRIELVLRPHKAKRTSWANAYYWGVVIALFAEHCGYDAEEMHEALKMRFLVRERGPMPTIRSSAALSTAEFAEYVDKCRRLAAEMGCAIPSPGDAE